MMRSFTAIKDELGILLDQQIERSREERGVLSHPCDDNGFENSVSRER